MTPWSRCAFTARSKLWRIRLIAVSDKWSEIQDGPTKGWVRSSIIKDKPPGVKKPRKKEADDDSDN